ncbi:uncharacterized protein LOC127787196 [Diospyros lotus]|uniref:uncharacterized protein LOC127787196 n=1 Tax=Diospyros lotus TaxID=55363 RepID=UPI002256C3C5|nr:uncharacterized protein LOC127787196 [Diospyros lotus]
MFRSARWWSEKNRIKAVFKLQFHATQVSEVGGDSLIMSLVPADVGKPTVRLEKAPIRDGSCFWENPVHETVKFFREPKTGKIHEKIYTLVISTGSSKSGIVGEVSIDFASYAESFKLSSVSLPLKNAKIDAVLHVSIQRMQENIDQREAEAAEEIENAKNSLKGRSLKIQLSIDDADESIQSNSSEDGSINKTSSDVAELKEVQASNGSDLTTSSSDGSSGLDTPRVYGLENNVHQDSTSFLPSVIHDTVTQRSSDFSSKIHEGHHRSQWEWLGGSSTEISTDDSLNSPRDALSPEKSGEASEVEIEKLRSQLAALSRQAEVSELEVQTLRKQIVKESKRAQDLSREVVTLKEERDDLRDECEKLKAFHKRMDEAKVKSKLQIERGDPCALLVELREELNYEKDLNSNLQLQLQKIQESNSELILAVRDLDEMLEQKSREILNLSSRSATGENAGEVWETKSKSETEDEEEKALEKLVKVHSDSKEAHMLEQKVKDLNSELEVYRREKDELEVQMEQLSLDYEILKQENHDLSYKLEQSQLQEQLKLQYECSSSYATINELETQIEYLESELNKQSNEYSDSLATISKLETRVRSLEEELEKQAQGFEADLDILMRAKVEQEQRAIKAEETFIKMRWQNAKTAERLQEEFKRLSLQMSSTFEANEKLATKALTEASELRLQKSLLEQLLQKENEELQSVRNQYEAELHELSNQISFKANQIEEMQSEIEHKSKQLEHEKMHAEESQKILSQEILVLRSEIGRLKTENIKLSVEEEQREKLEGELERKNTSIKEAELLFQRGHAERREMESVIASLRKEAEKSTEELNAMRSLKDENESKIESLHLELATVKSHYNKLKQLTSEEEFEKEKLRKQVSLLKGDLKKKEDALSSLEKKLKDTNSRSTVLDRAKTTSRNIRSAYVPSGPKEIANLKDKIIMLEGQIKLKQAALETSTNSFVQKEKDLQNKIEELEKRLEEICLNSAKLAEAQKVATYSEEEIGASASNARDQPNFDELLNEMESLKERNRSMEGELKEMQDRYSEISLKFAEVEGERQQLIMTLRNLKNAKKR